MKFQIFETVLIVSLLSFLVGCGQSDPTATGGQAPNEVAPIIEDDGKTESDKALQDHVATQQAAIELEWDDLIPADWRLDKLTEKYDLSNLEDDDPKAAQALEDLKAFWKQSPVVDDYNGKLIRLPGFMVPLEPNVDSVLEFLLVPYYGACIHTPPPPANQTIYVATSEDEPYAGGMFDTVWVTGRLSVEQIDSTYGTAGYRIDATTIAPYE